MANIFPYAWGTVLMGPLPTRSAHHPDLPGPSTVGPVLPHTIHVHVSPEWCRVEVFLITAGALLRFELLH